MKKNLLFLSLLISSVSFGQTIEPINVNIQAPIKSLGHTKNSAATKTTVCTFDTIQYADQKATAYAALAIASTNSSAVAQYFDVPQPLTISGAEFFGYKIDATGGTVIAVNLQVFTAGADSMPTGPALATAIVAVDTAFGGGLLSVLSKVGTFSPITVTSPYVVVVTNTSQYGMGIVFNSYTAGDGDFEWLSSMKFQSGWTRSHGVTAGGIPLNADVGIFPFVQATLKSSFTVDEPCFDGGLAKEFTNNSSPINYNRMYSLAAYAGLDEASFTWNFGDGTPEENEIDVNHTYTAAGGYNVVLTDSLFGWTRDCVSDTTIQLSAEPISIWTSAIADLGSEFTSTSITNGTATYLWDFGDGNTSTSQNPTHVYASAGTYTVCLKVTNNCGIDSTCADITVSVGSGVGLNDLGLSLTEVSPNPSNQSFVVKANSEMTTIQLIDLTGNEVLRNEVNNSSSSINVSELANGQYLLKVQFANGSMTNKRIQVQH